MDSNSGNHKSHGHKHEHGHAGHHHHHHAIENIKVAFFLNLFFSVIELIGGIFTNSVSILSDALHDLGDSISLGVAWYFEKKSKQKSNNKFTYGYRRFSILSALITGVVLTTGSILILFEAIPRITHPVTPHYNGMLGLAFLGIAVNGLAFLRLKKGDSLNEKVLSWHFIEDLLGWIFVLVGALIARFADLPVIDPISAILLSVWILFNVYKNLKQAVEIFLQASPQHIQFSTLSESLKKIENVSDIHHLHVWSLDGEINILTAHIVLKQNLEINQVCVTKNTIKQILKEKFNIHEATLEFEYPTENCLELTHI